MTVHFLRREPAFLPFVQCLKSLPNLHTLEIGWLRDSVAPALESALQSVELPQIKTLILPPAAYPLLQHCRDVEDVAYVIGYYGRSSDRFFKSFSSNRRSKIKRLVIPLVLQSNSSRKWLSTLL